MTDLRDSPDGLPQFADLPIRSGAPPGASWDVFGPHDQFGTLNFIQPSDVQAAADLVREGRVFPLNLDLWSPSPPLFHRSPPRRTPLILNNGESVDDYLDNFYPHGSTHWDALRHYADVDYGFYNGANLDAVTAVGSSLLAVQHWAQRGIAGRGVLIDIPRAMADAGTPIDPLGFFPVTAEIMSDVARRQGIEFRRGDIVLIRTGWLGAFTALADDARAELVAGRKPRGTRTVRRLDSSLPLGSNESRLPRATRPSSRPNGVARSCSFTYTRR